MRFVLRVLGTWLLALAVILIVIDGTKSLAANGLVMTSLSDAWTGMHPPSLSAAETFVRGRVLGDMMAGVFSALLTYPAFAVIGVPGILLSLLGRRRRRERYVSQDQF